MAVSPRSLVILFLVCVITLDSVASISSPLTNRGERRIQGKTERVPSVAITNVS